MMRLALVLVALTLLLAPRGVLADDADLIPEDVLGESVPAAATPGPAAASAAASRPSTLQARLFGEDALTASLLDDRVAVPYPSTPARWHNRTSFDVHAQWSPFDSLEVTLSDRLSLSVRERKVFTARGAIRNDLREGYVSWQPHSNLYLEVGRINVRNGVALGFNPSDFFKTRTLVGQASLDPSVVRQNRLGVFMLRSQWIWANGAAALAFAPRLTSPIPVLQRNPLGVDPQLAATNSAERVLGTLSVDLLNLSPQLLGYVETGRAKAGLSLSRPVGDALILYAEWAGGPERNLITRAIEFGKRTGTLPGTAPLLPATPTTTQFRSDVAAGASATLATRIMVNVEYHFHEAGLRYSEWRNWFSLGSAANASATLAGQLWFVRAYASDQLEPLTQHQMFLRAAWPRALVNELELAAYAFVGLLDRSVLSQASASYYLSNAWTASAYLSSNLGPRYSERGSFPERVSGTLQLTRYF